MTETRAPESVAPMGPVPRWRMVRPGRPMSGAGVWVGRAPWLALLGAIGLVIGAGVWPVAHLAPVDPVVPPEVPSIGSVRPSVADRERALATLTHDNLFAANRAFWKAEPVEVAQDTGTEAAAPGADGSPATGAGGAISPDGPVAMSKAEEMPPDIRAAFQNLRLVGVWSDSAGPPSAIMAFVQKLDATFVVGRGESFVDPATPQIKWVVVDIDLSRDRVVLERGGKRVSLALYPTEPEPPPGVADAVPEASPEASPDSAPKVAVVRATPEEIVRDLRAAGVDEQEIVRLMRMLEATPTGLAAAPQEPPSQDPPTGLEAVTELMQRAAESKRDRAPEAPPPAKDPG